MSFLVNILETIMNWSSATRALRFLAVSICLVATGTSWGALTELYFRAAVTTNTMADGRLAVMWGFAQDSSAAVQDGAATVPGPAIALGPGSQDLVIHLTNTLPEPVSLVIPSQQAVMGNPVRNPDGRVRSFTHEVPPGGVADYAWSNLQAGTFLYHSGSHPAIQVQMGLYGSLAKLSGAGMAYASVSFDSEVALLFSAIDPDLHDAVASGNYGPGMLVSSTLVYHPQYFLINGVSYTNGLAPVHAGQPNGRILLRILNADIDYHVPTLDGAYVKQVAEDGNQIPYSCEAYSIPLPPLKTIDAVLRVCETNTFALYDRRLGLMNSTNGSGGMLVFLDVSGAPLSLGDPVSQVAISLSNDHQRITLTWASASPATVLACTNRYYSADPADWFTLVEDVVPPWIHGTAVATPACYYRVANGGYTSDYDVGKFTVNVRQSDGAAPMENWIGCPLDLIDTLGNSVASKTFDQIMLDMCVSDATVVGNRDFVYSQDGIGGPTVNARRANGVWANIVGGVRATNFFTDQGYVVVISTAHTGPDKPLTFVGRVPTNAVLVGSIQQSDGAAPRENWVAYPYPAGAVTFDAAGLAAVVVDEPIVGNRDYVYSQDGVGGATLNARRGSGVWANVVGGTNATNLFGGQQYIITITPAHSGMATNWLVPKPY